VSEAVPPELPAGQPRAKSAPAGWAGVRLEAFQGSLERLLHLIRVDELDITTMCLSDIVRQYNEYLALIRNVEPDVAGDHVVGVATLIHLKSRRLLPPDPAVVSEDLATPEERAQMDRTARAELLRGAAEHLQEREAVMELVYLRPATSIAEYAGEQGIDADLFALLRAFREIVRRVGNEESAHISRERITLVERITWLMDTMHRERRVHFRSLFSGLADRVSCILTFLALLEVIRLRLVRASVSHQFEDILIVLNEDSSPSAPGPADA
jgi:segregation and condensation protein A